MYGDTERCYAANLVMGATLYTGRRFREALTIHLEIANDETHALRALPRELEHRCNLGEAIG